MQGNDLVSIKMPIIFSEGPQRTILRHQPEQGSRYKIEYPTVHAELLVRIYGEGLMDEDELTELLTRDEDGQFVLYSDDTFTVVHWLTLRNNRTGQTVTFDFDGNPRYERALESLIPFHYKKMTAEEIIINEKLQANFNDFFSSLDMDKIVSEEVSRLSTLLQRG